MKDRITSTIHINNTDIDGWSLVNSETDRKIITLLVNITQRALVK